MLSGFRTKPQPLCFHLLTQSRACSAKPHHMPWFQKSWSRMSPPGHSVLMGYLQLQELGITQEHWPWPQPLHSLTATNVTSPVYSPCFREKQHPIHAFCSRELALDSLGSCQCPPAAPPCSGHGFAEDVQDRGHSVPCASPCGRGDSCSCITPDPGAATSLVTHPWCHQAGAGQAGTPFPSLPSPG